MSTPSGSGPSGRGAPPGFLESLDPVRAAALLRSAPTSGEELPPEETIGRYRLVRRLGGGGMGIVYLAHDPSLERPVALKLLQPHLSLDETAQRRFLEEARAASALDHPHVGTVYEIGETDDGRLFIAMAYHEGETLRERLARGPLPVAEAARIAASVADGLAAAHGRGIVHRDVKPENLILTASGPKIVDFGIAKVAAHAMTRTGLRLGTAAYMSPEQTRGDPVDHRTDIWALGVVLYEMLTGRRPFRGEGDGALIYGIRNDAPDPVAEVRPDVPPSLASGVERCLEKDPARRYAAAGDLAAELRGFVPTSVTGTAATAAGPDLATTAARRDTRGPARVARLLREIHRRSLWQVLAVYLAASWLVLRASELVADRYLLPVWVQGFVLVLLLAGLPLVLATTMVRGGPSPRSGDAPTSGAGVRITTSPLTALAGSLRASALGSWLTWPRAVGGGVLAFGLLALLAGSIVARGMPRIAEGHGTAGADFGERRWIVVAEFEAAPGDVDLARAAREALTVDLQQSAHVNVHGRSAIAGVLGRMGLPDTIRLDEPLALDVAERMGAGAVLTASVSRLGAQFVLSGRALRPGTGEELFAVRTAAGEDRLLDGVETLSRDMRRRLGEERAGIRTSRPLPEVTTPSLDALKLYAEAEELALRPGGHQRALALAIEAIRLDPGFAMAHRLAGTMASNMLMWGEAREHQQAAFALRDRLTERERWHVEAAYHAAAMEHRRAADVLEMILDRYPDDPRAANNLGIVLGGWLDDREGAYQAFARARRADPLGPTWIGNSIGLAIETGRLAEGDSLAGVATELGYDELATRARLSLTFARGEVPVAVALCDSILAGAPGTARWPGDRELCGTMDLAMGRIERAVARLEEVAREHGERRRYHPMANTLAAVAVAEDLRGRADRADAALERLITDVPIEAIPDLDRLIIRTNVGAIAALLGRGDTLERIAAAYPPHPDPDNWFIRMGETILRAGGELASGHHRAALEILDAELPGDRWPEGWVIWIELFRGHAFQALGEPDSAAASFARVSDTDYAAVAASANYRLFLPLALRDLAEANEARGDHAAALASYQRLLDLWVDADPELEGHVAAVRAAVARLGGAGGR